MAEVCRANLLDRAFLVLFLKKYKEKIKHMIERFLNQRDVSQKIPGWFSFGEVLLAQKYPKLGDLSHGPQTPAGDQR
ncbi:hypothetical protein, partial [Anaerotignum lactatifermentans]|uniref:hypothetical protein n=1 Tax=Anaerotignum lactatifermentans TaxID=160404 RepID=UPI00196144A4